MDVVLESYADRADRYPPGAQGLHMIDTFLKAKSKGAVDYFVHSTFAVYATIITLM